MKLFLCPHLSTKCYASTLKQDYDESKNSRILYVGDQAAQVAGTTLQFTMNDSCGWHLIADSQFIHDKYIRITIESLNQVKCYLNSGSAIHTATNEVSCASDGVYDFDADHHVFLVVFGSGSGSYLQFKYQLVDRLTITQSAIIYSFSVFFFILLAGAVAVLAVRFCVQLVIKNHQLQWQRMAIEMRQMVAIAEKKKSMQNLGELENYIEEPRHKDYGRGYAPVVPMDSAGGLRDYHRKTRDDPQFNLY